jgi:antitoxin CptB
MNLAGRDATAIAKRLRYRSWHRGTREMDLLLGPFADGELAHMSEDELTIYAAVLELPDPQLYAILTGQMAIEAGPQAPMLDRILRHCASRHR